ncbi:MAG TPA: hypothetical protein VLE44_02215 [Candidatus Saccharimonadales bacterium]|nr:hypothetical protein [Candidatus Saccharimonadales bacterium]
MIKKVNRKAFLYSSFFTLVLFFFSIATSFAEKINNETIQGIIQLVYLPIYLLWFIYFALFSAGTYRLADSNFHAVMVIIVIPLIYFMLLCLFFYLVFIRLFNKDLEDNK